MIIFLHSHSKFVITHWQNSLTQYQLRIETNYSKLLYHLQNIDFNPLLLCDFSINVLELKEKIIELQTVSRPLILDCQADFSRGKVALDAGAFAYGNAMMHAVHLQSAITAVSEGKVWLYPDFISELITQLNQKKMPDNNLVQLDKLTQRERDVAILVKQGLNNKQIARKLEITVRTVKAHTGKIYEKLKVKDRLELVVLL
jgi:two-component system, NarL family, nitrate/nitrite response regulator NarL